MSKPETTAHPTPGESLSRHRSVWEARADGWIGMVDDLGRLADMSRDHADWEPCGARVRQLAQGLAPIESYWAFPGGRVFNDLALWVQRGEYARAHQAARRIQRMLAAQTYRHESILPGADADGPSQIETDAAVVRKQLDQEVYFEALQVQQLQQQVRIAGKADTVAARRFDVAKNRYLIGKIDITQVGSVEGSRGAILQALDSVLEQAVHAPNLHRVLDQIGDEIRDGTMDRKDRRRRRDE